MEDIIIIAVIGMIGVFSLVGMKMFKPNDRVKRAKKEVQDTAMKEVIDSKDLTITTLKDEMRSIKGKLYRTLQLEADNEEELPDMSSKQVTFEQIQALVKTRYPKYAKLLPLAKKQIMEAIKGMTLEEILDYVKEFTGNQQSQGQITPESATYNPNWA